MKKLIVFLIILLGLCVPAEAELRENGSTSNIVYFVMTDRTTGVRDTTITIGNLEMYYIEDQAAESADAFVGTHGAVTDAYTTGECIHVGHGVYRTDWPNAAFDGGIGKKVHLTLVDGDAGAFDETIMVELSVPVDSVLVDSVTPTSQAGQATATVNEWESQSQADPTGFHVNIKEVNGTAQTAGDISAQIATAQTDLDTITGTGGVLIGTDVMDRSGTLTVGATATITQDNIDDIAEGVRDVLVRGETLIRNSLGWLINELYKISGI
ncbi:hypothetical protein KAR91_85370 [Candidatus Pacearchaeota archaeon]|nr:hypothetical protein [Candidatus Pacearchaeota archaeon]